MLLKAVTIVCKKAVPHSVIRSFVALALFFIGAVLTVAVNADTLKPFTSDGCSVFPDGTLEEQTLWANCCIKHDLNYWKGGTRAQRLTADLALKQCVATVGKPEIAKLMLAGVRMGGGPYLPTSYRWGYGWDYPRGYRALSMSENQQIKQQLQQLEIMIQLLLSEIQRTHLGNEDTK